MFGEPLTVLSFGFEVRAARGSELVEFGFAAYLWLLHIHRDM